jgi:hypothetical protein
MGLSDKATERYNPEKEDYYKKNIKHPATGDKSGITTLIVILSAGGFIALMIFLMIGSSSKPKNTADTKIPANSDSIFTADILRDLQARDYADRAGNALSNQEAEISNQVTLISNLVTNQEALKKEIETKREQKVYYQRPSVSEASSEPAMPKIIIH